MFGVKDSGVADDNLLSAMGARPDKPVGGTIRPAAAAPGPVPEADASQRERTPWRPGVRSILIAVVLLPMAATGILVASSASAALKVRQDAGIVAQDATQLQVVASARAQMNTLQTPLTAVSYAAQLGISVSVLDQLLHPAVPFESQLAQGTAMIAGFPTFSSTSTLQDDVRTLKGIIPKVETKAISFTQVHVFTTKMANDIDNLWYRDYNQLQTDIATWQPPGSFEVHTAALRQSYQAFLAGGHEIEGAIYVLEGLGPAGSKQELIQAAGEYQTDTSQFAGQLSPGAEQAWRHLQTDPADKQFAATIAQGVTVALNGLPAPFAGNTSFAGTSMTPGLHYLKDLNRLVTAASADLHNTAIAQADAATNRLTGEILFLTLLALACIGGVIVAGRMLTRPLKRLAGVAHQAHNGDFDLAHLPANGPREVATTTAAFNDMASTLKAVEAKAVALAAEDLSDRDLFTALPGRTGRALQASVDILARRIREGEVQRQLLHQAAIHDGLTGLLNRAAVLDYLTNDVGRRRNAGETVAVLFIDLDRLKPLNDAYGHEVGDGAILATAMALMQATDACDVVGRLGGDEFLIVLCHDHSCVGDAVVQHIGEIMSQCRIPVGDTLVPLEASVGVALAQCDSDTDPMRLVREADEAMYEAKKSARAARDQLPSHKP